MASEAERAAEYRRMMRARAKNKRAAERALRGDPVALAALKVKTAPLLFGPDGDGVSRVDPSR